MLRVAAKPALIGLSRGILASSTALAFVFVEVNQLANQLTTFKRKLELSGFPRPRYIPTMTWNPHVTVAAVCERNGRFLSIEERSHGQLVFNQPAGHLDPNESLTEAVIRETLEETAYHFRPTALLGLYLWRNPFNDSTILRTAFIGECDGEQLDQPLDDGIIAAHWMSRDELEATERLRSPLVLNCIDDYLAGRSMPLESVHDALDRATNQITDAHE